MSKENPCIIVLTHPNTEEKLNLLNKCLLQLKKTKYSIYVFANMNIDLEILKTIDGFIYTGENKMYSASDFLNIKTITEARNTSKYRYHLTIDDKNIITYIPITYGTEKSYYWSCINLYKVALEFVKNSSHTHFMLTQYDSIIPDCDLHLIDSNFNELCSNNLDGSFPVDPNMGNNHLNGDIFFGDVKWWNDLFNVMTPVDFYNRTFPNWTPEEYFYIKTKEKEGKIKIKVRTNLEEWEKQYYLDIPSNWIREDINSSTRKPVHLYFPNIHNTGLSNYWDTPYFDIEKSLIVSIQPLDDNYQIFVYNKIISKHDKEISINITFPIENDTDIEITPINLELSPGTWNIRNYQKQIVGRKVNINYSYFEDDKLITNIKTYYI
jgi:hypothetical protein